MAAAIVLKKVVVCLKGVGYVAGGVLLDQGEETEAGNDILEQVDIIMLGEWKLYILTKMTTVMGS